jgi:hypothetical protein
MTATTVTQTSDIPACRADRLKPGARIAAGWLPLRGPADVLFAVAYHQTRRLQDWVMVVYRYDDGTVDSDHFLADAQIPVEPAADDGMGFSDLADRLHGEDKAIPVDADVHALGRAAQ